MSNATRTGLEPVSPGRQPRIIPIYQRAMNLESPTGFEPALSKLKAWCPSPKLDDGDIVWRTGRDSNPRYLP